MKSRFNVEGAGEAMMTKILDFLFACRHEHRGWPRYDFKRENRGVYQCCLDCGKELPYINPELMHKL
jgi:hypothetical protein